MRNTYILAIIIVVLYIPLACLDYNHFPYSDGAEHGAAVRELAKRMISPEDPMLANHPGDSPRFVPSILVMALVMKLLDLDVLIVLKFFLVVYFALFLAAAFLFSREYCNGAGQFPWAVASLLFLWGLGWTGSSAYMFSALLYTAYFPSVVSFSLALLALFFQLRFLRYKKTGLLIAQILLGSFAFVNHPPTGVFFFICSGLLYLEKRECDQQTLLYYSLSVATALLLITLWPYYSFFANFFKVASGEMAQTADYQLARHYHYSKFLLRSGPALAGIPFLALFLLRKSNFLLIGGFIVFSCIYLAGYFFGISLANHFVFFSIFTLQMAVSQTLKEWFSFPLCAVTGDSKRITVWFLLLLLTLGLLIQVVFVFTKFITPAISLQSGSYFPQYRSPNTIQLELKKHLGDGDVVLSDIYTSWSIPVYTGAKIIALFHTSPHVNDNLERIEDVKTFYASSTTRDTRKKLLKKYGATHICLNFLTAGKDIESSLKEMDFPIVARSKDFCLFSIHPPTGEESTPGKGT